MCRIAGIISNNRYPGEMYQKVKAMCESMKHGGPDDEGFYLNEDLGICFGHRRLSLLDLSSAGHQPMFDADEKIWIVYNGEVYNFQDIRSELESFGYVFKSGTDTEVILKAYRHWGIEAFSRFNGMFAFSLADLSKSVVYLVRDAVGIKPLYYSYSQEELIFSSEVKAFRQVRQHWPQHSDWELLLLAFGHIPEPYTTLENVYALPKGTYLTFDLYTRSSQVKTFRKVGFREPATAEKEEAIEAVRVGLEKAVKRHLIADAPVGLFLSGGIDSSLLTLLSADQIRENLKTLSVTFSEEEFSEKQYQQEVITKARCDHHFYSLAAHDLHENLHHIISAYDQPSADAINSWFISKYAKENGLKAVLSGVGSDEVFGGYPSFNRLGKLLQLQKLPEFLLSSLKLFGDRFHRLDWLQISGVTGLYLALRGCFSPRELAAILDISVGEILDRIAGLSFQPDEDVPNSEMACWLEFNRYMQNQLLKDSDYMSMQHGIELRVPFLDQDFLDAVFGVDTNILYKHKGMPKQLLIDAFKDILPEKVWNRNKMGFSFPFQKWLGSIQRVRQVLSEDANGRYLLKSFDQGHLHWSKLWTYYLSKNFAA